ncbi:putative microtubule and actin binding protein, partial [Plasmodium gaboni]
TNKNEIVKLNKMLEETNKKIKKRDMEMYILLEENKKQKEKAAKKMTKVNALLNNLHKEYTDNIP